MPANLLRIAKAASAPFPPPAAALHTLREFSSAHEDFAWLAERSNLRLCRDGFTNLCRQTTMLDRPLRRE